METTETAERRKTLLRSLERVNGLKLQPGSEIRFCRGGSWKGMLVLRDSGTRFEPIRISSYGEGEMPEIDGCGAGPESG